MELVQQQLRQAREARGLSLAALEHAVGVRTQVLALIERGAFGELPTGLYGRHAIRAYATAVGLDADVVLGRVGPALPEAEDPLDGLARVRGLTRRAKVRSSAGAAAPAPKVVDAAIEHCTGSAPSWRTLAASAIDSALLVCVMVATAHLTAFAAGAPLSDVIAVAAPAWGLMAVVIGALYFVLLAGVRSATLGARLVEAPVAGHLKGMDAATAIRRGLRCAMRESSILVDWLVTRRSGSHWLRALSQRG